MIVLDRIVHETIWGGNRLSFCVETGEQHIGHLYSVFCRENISNTILNGEHKGKKLNDIYNDFCKKFNMSTPFFPLTIALTEADEDLSIQVHPDDIAASKLENKARGKRESWYFLEAPKSGGIVNGCKIKNKEECKIAIDENRYDDIIDKIPVSVGDYVFVEPGTLHSISAGSLVYEIEEGADFTYRFYDYNRLDSNGNERELHTEKAFLSLNPILQSKSEKYPENGIIKEKTYLTKKIINAKKYANTSDTLECFTLIDGVCVCDGIKLSKGQTVLLFPNEVLENISVNLAFVAVYIGG